uniref:Transmembrane protein 35B n=1 Tax=Falco tinnunculus TaxID=100819 RepID=A0A8C4UGS3_FALTI
MGGRVLSCCNPLLRVWLGFSFPLVPGLLLFITPWHSSRSREKPQMILSSSSFVRYAEVFPLKELGFTPEPGWYLEVVGWVEAVAGLLLAFGPQLLQEISNFILSVIMIGAIYTLLVLREPLAMCAPATLCLGLLLLLNIRGHAAPAKPKFE